MRLDGADIYSWDKSELGPHVGYLSQQAELFEGSFAENIARFGIPDMLKVKAAVALVGLQDLVDQLDHGYDTDIGEDGAFLSGGERQRVALARAIYGSPRFVVLDEPNASLDQAGDLALLQTIALLKAQGTTLVIITHRPSLLTLMDEIMVLIDGQIKLYGPRDQVMDKLQPQAVPLAPSIDGQGPV